MDTLNAAVIVYAAVSTTLLFFLWVCVFKPLIEKNQESKRFKEFYKRAELARTIQERTKQYEQYKEVRQQLIDEGATQEFMSYIDKRIAETKSMGVFSNSQEVVFVKLTLRAIFSPIRI